MKDLTFSVIIPLYNVAPYIRECLDSLINQSYSNFEVIMVDDGSVDESAAIASRYCEKDGRFSLYQQKNGGASAARNNALERVVGDYVIFLDGDDYLVTDALRILFEFCSKNKPDFVKFGANVFFDDERILRYEEKHRPGYSSYYYGHTYPLNNTGQELLCMLYENREYYVSACLTCVRRVFIQENHLKFRCGVIHEDNILNIQMMTLAKKANVLSIPLYCRRYRSDSTLPRERADKRREIVCLYAVCEEILKLLSKHPEIKNLMPYESELKSHGKKIMRFYRELESEGKQDIQIRYRYGMTCAWMEKKGFVRRKKNMRLVPFRILTDLNKIRYRFLG